MIKAWEIFGCMQITVVMQIYYVHADKFKGVCGYILVPCIHLYMFAKQVRKAFNKIKEFVTKFNPQ